MIQNKLLRNFVKFLLLLLILAFTFGGLGDVFSRKELPYALKIADIEYSFFYINKIFQETIKESRLKYGQDLSKNDITKLKVDILRNIIDSTLILLQARGLGIVANDNMVKREILKSPIFFKNGKFDKDIFNQIIKNYGLSEKGFIDKLKEEIIRAEFLDSISINKSVIPGLTKVILQDELQTRDIKLIKIPFSAFKVSDSPQDNQLELIYKKNKSKFKIPEKRTVEYAVISLEFFKENPSKVDDDKIRKIYNEKSFLFKELEKRDILQVQFSSLNNAKKAREELIKGVNFKRIAKKYSPNFKNYNLGIITAKDFNSDISEKLFKLKVGEISEIIETPLGFYIFKVERIIPEKNQSFEQVKSLLKKEYLKDIEFNNFLKSIKNIQNDLKQGKSLELIAKEYNQKVHIIEITNLVDKGNYIAKNKAFVENSFKTKLNEQSEVFSIDSDKFCILRVNKVIPEEDQKFDEVKAQLKEIWYNDELSLLTNKINISDEEEINSEINNKLFDFSHAKISKINLGSNINNKIPLNFYKNIIDLKTNFYSKPFVDYSHKEVLFAKLEKVNLPSEEDIEKHRLLYDSQINQLEQKLILRDILRKLRDKFKIVINHKIFDNNF